MNPGFSDIVEKRLKPGDLLIYSRRSFFGWCIKVKTWSNYTHVETYLGNGYSHASRDSAKFFGTPLPGTGVGTFQSSYDGLVLVRRPRFHFNLEAARPYIDRVAGECYDVAGIFRFFTLGRQSVDKQFCSEDATRLARAAGIEPFDHRLDADLASPRDLAFSAAYMDLMVYPTVPHDQVTSGDLR